MMTMTVLDGDDPCSSTRASNLTTTTAYDDMVGVGGAGVNFDGTACDPAAYDIDSNDDNDDWSDVDEVSCGADQWTRGLPR